jgi:FlaG/FlaF family flagellin (archaellin)
MSNLHAVLPQIRFVILIALAVFLAATMSVSLFEMLETRTAKRDLLALLLSSYAISAWFILTHKPG